MIQFLNGTVCKFLKNVVGGWLNLPSIYLLYKMSSAFAPDWSAVLVLSERLKLSIKVKQKLSILKPVIDFERGQTGDVWAPKIMVHN